MRPATFSREEWLPASGTKYILAVDLGASAIKVALMTVEGAIVANESEPQRVKLLPGGGAEQDPEDSWRGMVSDLLKRYIDLLYRVERGARPCRPNSSEG